MTTKLSSVNIEPATLASFSGPTVSSVTVANVSYVSIDDTAVSNAGGYVIIEGSGFGSGAQVLFGSTPATSVTYVNSSKLNVQVPELSAGSYVVYIQNPDGSTAIRLNGITSSPIPVWGTDSTLTSQASGDTFSISLSANSDSNVSYVLSSGSSLPSGTTLAANGLLSGTVTIEDQTTYNFSIDAIDQENQEATRSFSITIIAGDLYYKDTVLHLSADTDTWITDASANKSQLTVVGDAKPTKLNPFNDTASGSTYFDGTGDRLTVPASSDFEFTGDFTVEAWMNFDTLSGSPKSLIGLKNVSSWFDIRYYNGNWQISFNSGGGTNIAASPDPVVGTWCHVAVVRSGSTVSLYVDGVLGGSTTNSSTLGYSSVDLGIGADASGSNQLQGYISNLRIVNGTAVYTEAFSPPTSPLTAITNTVLLTCQSHISENNNRFVDESGSNNIITRNGNTTQGNFSPHGVHGWSNYFDGTGDYLTTSYDSSLPAGTGDFCIEAWVYMTASLALNDSIASVSGDWQVSWQTSGFCFMPDGSNRLVNTNALEAMELHRWYHVAFTRESGTMRSYLNGVFTGSIANTTNHNDTVNGLVIGNNRGGTGYFAGYIADVRYVVGSAVYTTESSFTLPTTSLTAITNTKLLTCQSNRFIDNSTNNLTITKSGDASVQPFSPLKPTGQWSATTVGGSMYFDGTGDYIDVINSSTCSNFGTNDITIEGWYYFTQVTGTQQILYDFRVSSSDVAGALAWTGSSLGWYVSGAYIISGGSVVTNTWYHIALVRESGNTKLYLNGTQVGSTYVDSNNYVGNTNRPRIGYLGDGTGTLPFFGYMSNLRIVKGTAVYTNAFTPPTAPVTAISGTSLLLNGTNGGIIDYTGKNNLETVGDVKVRSDIVKYGTGAMYFDNTVDYITVPGSPSFDFGTGNFTLECWIYPLALSGTTCILDAWNNAPTRFLLRTNGTALQFYTSYGNMSYTLPGANAWYHVAAVRNGSTTSLYVNGVSVGTPISSSATITASTALWTISRGAETWNGYIDDIRITKGVARYTENFTPPSAAFQKR